MYRVMVMRILSHPGHGNLVSEAESRTSYLDLNCHPQDLLTSEKEVLLSSTQLNKSGGSHSNHCNATAPHIRFNPYILKL